MTDTDRLAAIEVRAEEATEGPWESDGVEGQVFGRRGLVVDGITMWAEDDARFIAHAREDVPWLVEQVRTLTAERDRLAESYEDGYDQGHADAHADGAAEDRVCRERRRAETAEEQVRTLTAENERLREEMAQMDRTHDLVLTATQHRLAAAEATMQRVRDVHDVWTNRPLGANAWPYVHHWLRDLRRALDGDGSPTEGGE